LARREGVRVAASREHGNRYHPRAPTPHPTIQGQREMPLRAGKKVLTGALSWAAIAAAIAVAFERIEPATRARLDHVCDETWRTVRERAPEFRVRFAGAAAAGRLVERNNGVLARVDGRIERVGEVTRVRLEGDDVVVTIALDRERATFPMRQGARAVRRSQG